MYSTIKLQLLINKVMCELLLNAQLQWLISIPKRTKTLISDVVLYGLFIPYNITGQKKYSPP